MFNQRWCIAPEFMALMVDIYEKRADFGMIKKNAVTRKDAMLGRNAKIPEGVALVECYGPIIPFANMIEEACGSVSVEAMRKSFRAGMADDSVHTVLFDSNSPGGNVEEIASFADEIREARKHKHIVAFAGGSCNSAAYWLASQAETVYCDQTTELGSIGVLTWAAKSEDNKIVLTNSDSPKKALGLGSEEGQNEILKILDDTAAVFFNQVSAGRGLSVEDIKAFEGRVFVGETAVAKGLADEISDFEGLLNKLSKNERKNAMTDEEKKAFDDANAKIAALEAEKIALKNENDKLAADVANATADGDKKAFSAAVNGKLAVMKAAGLKDDHPVVANFSAMFDDYSMYAGKDWQKKIDAYVVPGGKLAITLGGDNHGDGGKEASTDADVKAKTTM